MSDLSQVAVYSDSSDIYKVSDGDEMDDGSYEGVDSGDCIALYIWHEIESSSSWLGIVFWEYFI